MLKTGERVSFINEKLSGTIMQVHGDGRLTLMLDDGFEMQVSSAEVVSEGKGMQIFAKATQESKNKKVIQAGEELITENKLRNWPGKLAPDQTVSLVSLPAQGNQISKGPVVFRIENNTAWHVCTLLALVKENKHTTVVSTIIEPMQHVTSQSFEREALQIHQNFHCQLICYKTTLYECLKPLAIDLAIQMPDWQVADAVAKGLDAFARIQVIKEFKESVINLTHLVEGFRNREPKEFTHKDSRQNCFVVELETDLHWYYNNTDSSDSEAVILEEQIKMIHKTMTDAFKRNAESVVFIHGIGNGVLKKVLLDELKSYKTIKVTPANTARYGGGATKILLK